MPAPNVLLITVDQWPGYLLGCAGHEVILTPTLDALAATGVRFDRAHSECPVCIPARRSLMTGLSPRSHGVRSYQPGVALPAECPTLPGVFRDAGYQTGAVGKLHLHPVRRRYGFEELLLSEEGRMEGGLLDDYDIHVADHGYPGQHYAHGLGSNSYETRAWHLPDDLHVTNWATKNMVRMIQRRDPSKPAFWYLSYSPPHPPLAPLQAYLELYRGAEIDPPWVGDWVRDAPPLSPYATQEARRAFYALCTHIDHQIRLVLAALRQEGLMQDTIVAFSADHGEMLGNHAQWGKRCMLGPSTGVPLLIAGNDERLSASAGRVDSRLVLWQDIMPTLLDLAGLPVPEGIDGLSALGPSRRSHLYGEEGESGGATRLIRRDAFKLIYVATENRFLLFDLEADPRELRNLADDLAYGEIFRELLGLLQTELYGNDLGWVSDGEWVGHRAADEAPAAWNLNLGNQRSYLFPPPSVSPGAG
jgi:arylsulfatase